MIDGLGDNYLMRRRGGALARRRRASMTSVFPSTTASAITTSYTGRTPLEHGLTGWFTYFGEAGCVAPRCRFAAAATCCRSRSAASRRSRSTSRRRCSRTCRCADRRHAQGHHRLGVQLRHCRGAQRVAYETLDELVANVEAAVKSGAERKFVYAYWPVYDMLSHRFGAESAEAFAALEAIDAAFACSRGSPAPSRSSSPPPITASSTCRPRTRSSCLRRSLRC